MDVYECFPSLANFEFCHERNDTSLNDLYQTLSCAKRAVSLQTTPPHDKSEDFDEVEQTESTAHNLGELQVVIKN